MQHGEVDISITGTDRVTRQGDVANKIGTYLKALAARDNGIPFWVALPHSTLDWRRPGGVARIPVAEGGGGRVEGGARRHARRRVAKGGGVAAGRGAGDTALYATPPR